MRFATRSGFTLVELLASMAVMAIGLAVVTGSILRSARPDDETSARTERLREAKARAVLSGVAVIVPPDSAAPDSPTLFLPDGRSVGLAEDGLPDGSDTP